MENNQDKKKRLQRPITIPKPVFYEIKVQGHLDPLWSTRFDGMTLKHTEDDENGAACTLISGPVTDQAALHGLLARIRDLNLMLISVQRIVPETSTSEGTPTESER
jgi:hypothetical protein